MSWLRCLVALLVCAPLVNANDWPQWLGPHRDGATSESVAPWKGKPTVVWRQRVGEGHSSPVVANGKVYLLTKVPDQEAEQLTAYDEATGKPLWHTSYQRGKFTSLFGNGPRATPSVVKGRVYTNGATGILSCFDAETGKQLWQVDTLAKFHATNLKFGVSCSPLVLNGMVLVNVGARGASIVAFDAADGHLRWQSGNDPASYSSPIALGQWKVGQVLFVTGRHVLSVDPQSGQVFWEFPMMDLLSESSSTPVAMDKMVMVSSVTLGSTAYGISIQDGKPGAKQMWKNKALTCYFSTPVEVPKVGLFMVTGTFFPPIQATLRCVAPETGKQLWEKRGVGRYHAALIRTGNGKLLMMQDSGVLVLLDPGKAGYHELARAKICGETWAHPAVANGRLLVRDDKQLISVELSRASGQAE